MISLIVPCYNEQESIPLFYEEASRVLKGMDIGYELIFVNDGSTDKSSKVLFDLSLSDEKIKVIEFARNFGHEAAMIAGIDYASGEFLICMDADLQHPPALIPKIVEKLDEGYDVVSMVRTYNPDAGFFNRFASNAFYKVLNFFSPIKFENNSSDFFAISREVAQVLKQDYREKVRYLRGYVQSIGFKRTSLEFEAAPRAAGKSKYNFGKLVNYSIHALCSFSDLPLRMGLYSGIFVAILGLILMIYSICQKIFNNVPAGYTTIVIALCFLFAVTLLIIGIIGEYISVVFAEVKNRPIYIVKNTENLSDCSVQNTHCAEKENIKSDSKDKACD